MPIKLFVLACILGGVGGLVGSILGGAFGQNGLFVGGFVGGAAIAPLSAKLALWRGWIAANQYWATAIGAAVGFLLAATIAINTLSSPVGPLSSTLLIGLGAVAGQKLRRSKAG